MHAKSSFLFASIALVALSILLAGCVQGGLGGAVVAGDVAVNGTKVTVDYVGRFQNGTLFDTSIAAEARAAGINVTKELEPLVFKLGASEVIPGFEKAVLGMRVNEEKTLTITPEEAYGPHRQDMILKVNETEIQQGGGKPVVGGYVTSFTGSVGVITSIENGLVSIDFNHPLAGKTLVFKIMLRKVQPG